MTALICFDVDGCLIDSDVPMMAALNEALFGFGLPMVELEQLRAHLGPPLVDTMRGLLADLHQPSGKAETLATAYRQAYARASVLNVSVHAGIPALLAELTADGHELLVVSSKPRRYSGPLLEAAGLASYFAGIYGPLGAETEPKQLTLARSLQQRPAPTTTAYMVGDTEADIVAAHANGVMSIAVTWGYATLERLRAAGPDHLVTTPGQVAGIVTERSA